MKRKDLHIQVYQNQTLVKDHRFTLQKTLLIGSHPECDLVLHCQSIAENQAILLLKKDDFYLKTLNPKNPLLTSFGPLIETKLQPNSCIQIGSFSFRFSFENKKIPLAHSLQHLLRPSSLAKTDRLQGLPYKGIERSSAQLLALEATLIWQGEILDSQVFFPRR